MNELVLVIFQLVVLLFSAIIHEVSHGYAAYKMGDNTAKNEGRLTLNPLSHLDPFGSVVLPLLLYFASAGSFVIGWAKPVPFNPFNLKNPKRDSGIIAVAGPASNLLIACLAALILRFSPFLGGIVNPIFLQIVVIINLSLMIFNLVPIPPLDGSKILFAFLPVRFYRLQTTLEQYGMWILIAFIFFGFSLIVPIIYFLYNLLV
ncbi:MAG TPA: site-2 protease family protein [Candidatus Paceibacterota bacterium]|nr:site-2 protease family protein [Candidatus Paceibacterota bacterium]